MADPRDATMVRRALLAGAAVAVLVAVPLLVAVASGGGSGGDGLAVTVLGFAVGGVVASLWLLLGTMLDLLGGQHPGRLRVVALLIVVTLTLISPLLLAAAER